MKATRAPDRQVSRPMPRDLKRLKDVALGFASVILGVCVGASIAVSPLAQAANSTGVTGSTACNQLNMMETSNSTFTYFRQALETPMQAAVAWNATNNVNPTDLSVVQHSSNTTSTDAVYNDGNYTTFCGFTWHGSGGNTTGLAKCNNLGSGNFCDRHYIYFDTSAVNASDFDLPRERRLACHETGHVFGIKHTTGNTCMAANIITNYHAHEIIDIINWIW